MVLKIVPVEDFGFNDTLLRRVLQFQMCQAIFFHNAAYVEVKHLFQVESLYLH